MLCVLYAHPINVLKSFQSQLTIKHLNLDPEKSLNFFEVFHDYMSFHLK